MKKTAATVSVILISLLLLLAGCGSRNNEQSGGIEVRNNGQYIQWTTGDGQWHDLVDIKEITSSVSSSISQKSIEIENSGGYIKWRYTDGEWNNLISVSSLTGRNGADGKDGKDGADGRDGINGQDGESIEICRADGYVRWRYYNGEWQNLVALSDITGPAGANGNGGKTPEFRVEAGTLQWKYTSDSIWLNLYDLSLLKGRDGTDGKDGINGQDGADGTNGTDGRDGINGQDGKDGREIEVRATDSHIQWRYSNGEWQNLVAISDITGPAGANGNDGKTPEFRVEAGTLQWKYTSDSIWLNLYDLSLLKGRDGTDGKDGINGKDGVNGKDGINGKDGLCAGYFAASGEVFSNSWNSPLPFTAGSKSGELISYDASNKQIILAKGHSYSLVFSGTVSVSAKKDETICGAALIDGQNNADVMLTTQTFVNAAKNGQTNKLTIAYNTIYTAKDSDTVLTFMFNNMTFQDTAFAGARYSITVIALN